MQKSIKSALWAGRIGILLVPWVFCQHIAPELLGVLRPIMVLSSDWMGGKEELLDALTVGLRVAEPATDP